jgi:phospholipid/cholesterol/gamma-HCH transport system ATP-binding protein
MIRLNGVRMGFGEIPLLNDISFEISPGEKVSLVGPGGSGKSTILKILLGLLKPEAGQVELMGIDMVGTPEIERQKILRSVGMAFQQGALFDFMTVRENLIFAMEHMTNLTSREMDQRIKALLQGVKLGRTELMYPFELSGGMQRRVGIARALCTNPKIAIFDEPTSGLDPVTSTIILNMITELSKSPQSPSQGPKQEAESGDRIQMIVTSNIEIGIRFAERLIVINDGYVVADGSWKDLLLNGSEWVKHFLGVRFIGLDLEYAHELKLPQEFIEQHWASP